MERKIGEIFEYNGEWYQCVKSPDGSCKHCDMNFGGKCPIPIKECVASSRSDLFYVIFKKLEKVGEPFTIVGKLHQHYKVFDIDNVCGDGPWCVYNYKAKTLTIEIKQNKDMKTNNLNLSNSENIGKNLKPFDFEAAKAGKPVCTRSGKPVRIICFDVKAKKPIAALITNDDTEEAHFYYDNGRSDQYQEYRYDLMMLPEKKEGWVNVSKFSTYASKEEALSHKTYDIIDTIKVSWEE